MSLSEKLRSELSLPILAAPLFIVSNPDLVVAQCTSGIIGSFPALNARPAEILAHEIDQIGHVGGAIEDLARQNVIQVVLRLSREGRIELRKSEPAKLPLSTLPPLSYDGPFPATSPVN